MTTAGTPFELVGLSKGHCVASPAGELQLQQTVKMSKLHQEQQRAKAEPEEHREVDVSSGGDYCNYDECRNTTTGVGGVSNPTSPSFVSLVSLERIVVGIVMSALFVVLVSMSDLVGSTTTTTFVAAAVPMTMKDTVLDNTAESKKETNVFDGTTSMIQQKQQEETGGSANSLHHTVMVTRGLGGMGHHAKTYHVSSLSSTDAKDIWRHCQMGAEVILEYNCFTPSKLKCDNDSDNKKDNGNPTVYTYRLLEMEGETTIITCYAGKNSLCDVTNSEVICPVADPYLYSFCGVDASGAFTSCQSYFNDPPVSLCSGGDGDDPTCVYSCDENLNRSNSDCPDGTTCFQFQCMDPDSLPKGWCVSDTDCANNCDPEFGNSNCDNHRTCQEERNQYCPEI